MGVFRRLFRFSVRSRTDIAGDVRDEISFHLEMRGRELVDRGWAPDAAAREARRQFGDVDTTAAYCRRLDVDKEKGVRTRSYAAEFWQDVLYGARMLWRQPGHSAVALLTIAIGIGATTLVFSLVHAVLLAPLPYPNADRLMVLRASVPDYTDVRASTDLFEASGIYARNLYMVEDEQLLAGVVTPGFFSALGVGPLFGRVFEERDGAAPLVILSHGFWQRRFGSDPGVIGRPLVLSGNAHIIVGVMPARFQFPSRAFQMWTNFDFAMTMAPQQPKNRALRIFQAVNLLRPTITQEQAQAQLTTLAGRLESAYPETNGGVALTLVPIRDRLVGDVRTALLVALGSVGCLLFIACANVASLTLARMTSRMQELAVRAALGAGRYRIARQLTTESLLTAVCGGLLGVFVAWLGLAALPALIGDRVPRADEIALNLPVLGVSAAAILIGGLLVAIFPVVQLSMTEIEPALRSGSRGGETRFGIRLRATLVVAQIAVAVIVLSGALVLTRSFVRLLNADPGFDPDGVLSFNLPLIEQNGSDARVVAVERSLEAIAAVPGVTHVGGATGLPLVTAQRGTSFEVEGRSDMAADQRSAYFIAASPGYFRTLRTTIVGGREFDAKDTGRSQLVVVISKTLERRFFPHGDAVGRRLRLVNPEQSGEWRTIVGVAGDVRYQGLEDVDPAVVYTPFAQTPFPWIYVEVRATGDPMALLGSIRHAVKSVNTKLPVANPQMMTSFVTQGSADPRFRTTLVALFAAAGMLLAAVGLHGVVAFGVARRAREIAIRLALGASMASVRRRVVVQSMMLALAGVAAGLVAAVWMGGLLSGLLYETAPTDPAALAAVVVVLLIVAIAASVVPARRATRIQPVEALRDV
jgi:predicted permease